MQVPTTIFREYDIRGKAERDLTTPLATAIGRSFGSILRETAARPTVALSRDARLSGPRLFDAVSAGLRAAGCDVVDVGIGPTPQLYFAAHELGTDGALMITGSHNPGDENGVKMLRGTASFFGRDIQDLKGRIEREDYASGEGSSRTVSVEDAYVAALVAKLAFGEKKPKVVLDAGNGAGGPLALRAFAQAGIDVVGLYCDMDGTFPNHHPDPTEPHNLEDLIRKVKETGADLGLALDGDADRLGAVDRDGRIVWGDKLLVLFARDVLEKHPGAAILGEVKCSQTTYDDITAHGGRAILWKTGHSLIKTKMREEGALLAGEMSGHLFFKDRWPGFDDGIYAALRLTELLSRKGRTMGELLADLPETSVTPEIRVDCPDLVKTDVVTAVREHYRKTHEVIEVDGARVLFGDGAWGLVRASNTQPVLVLRFEARTDAVRDRLRDEVTTLVQREIAARS